ncbi:MAG: hypothetical protein L0Z62_08110 [Gemmataceae bacterium]|nr:hypothetical protein [Gemmataceae bacterium]
MSARITALCATCLALTLAGCGDGTHSVSGTVSFDGQPVETGTIVFEAADGGPGLASSGIKNGKYELRSKAGKKKVVITAFRPKPGTEKDPQPATEEYIPAKYNTESTLTKEVVAGENKFDFDLKK